MDSAQASDTSVADVVFVSLSSENVVVRDGGQFMLCFHDTKVICTVDNVDLMLGQPIDTTACT